MHALYLVLWCSLIAALNAFLVRPSSSSSAQRYSARLPDGGVRLRENEGISELPNDFMDSIERAAQSSLKCINVGSMRVRIDFDTSIGDQTYSTLNNALPFVKELVKFMSDEMSLSVPPVKPVVEEEEQEEEEMGEQESQDEGGSAVAPPVAPVVAVVKEEVVEEEAPFQVTRSVRIFFPDMGAAALARRDWKLNSNTGETPELPPCVYTANIQNDELESTDQLAIILCPLYSEVDFVRRVMNLCTNQGIACIMINPDLVNMDQGFGVKARRIRDEILNTFVTSYKLKTLPNGAVVREWPLGYTVWVEDGTKDDGYSMLNNFEGRNPTREEVSDLIDEWENPGQAKEQAGNVVSAGVNEIVGFFKGMSRL